MGLQARAGFVGIVTATGEMAAQQGALRKADNVTLRRQGALQLRQTWNQSTVLTRTYRAVFWYKGSRYYIADLNVLYGQTEAAIAAPSYPLTPSLTPVRADIFTWEESRGNLYFPSARGVYKLTSAATTQLINAGLSANEAGVAFYQLINVVPNILANNSHFAYRLVAKRTDPNGVIIRSRPSGAVIVLNTSGAARTPRLDLTLETTYLTQPVDEVEIYRTRTFPNTVQPDDEMQLVGTIKATQFSFGAYTWDDTTADIERTTTLYTSPSRGGIENANDRPPGAACIESFRGHVFYGNTTSPQRFIVSYNYDTGDISGVHTGVGDRAGLGTWSSGSPTLTITSPGDDLGVQRGQTVFLNGAQNGWVTNIVGTTVTMSQNASTSGTTQLIVFRDAISLDNGATWVTLGKNGTTTANFRVQNGPARYNTYELTPPAPGFDATLVMETKQRGAAPMQILATHGNEMSPPLGLWGGTATPSTSDTFIHGLQWSEPDEPEHCPPKNFARVGDGSKAILGLTVMRDSLLIWKEDGLFRLTGATASGFRIDPFDPTVVCILPGSLRRLRDSVFALTTLGIVRVTESAADIVSAPIGPDVATQLIEPVRAYYAANSIYRPPSIEPCVAATADEGNGEYWLMTGTPWETALGGQVFVFSMERGGFTTYSLAGAAASVTGFGQNQLGQPAYLTVAPGAGLYEPSTSPLGNITARVTPHDFSDPGLTGKLWTHVLAGFSTIGAASSIQALFTSSEAQIAASVTESFDAPTVGGNVTFVGGTLLRHLVPQAMRRAWALRVELIVNAVASSFVLELIGAESREDVPNKKQSTGSGAT